jgi:microcystin-dependent protein
MAAARRLSLWTAGPATLRATNSKASKEHPAGNVLAKTKKDEVYHPGPATAAMGSSAISVGNTGEGQPVEIRQPYLGLRYCIAVEGVFPTPP